jgi:hypothetical protein
VNHLNRKARKAEVLLEVQKEKEMQRLKVRRCMREDQEYLRQLLKRR